MFNIALSLTKISRNPISFLIKLSEEKKKERKIENQINEKKETIE